MHTWCMFGTANVDLIGYELPLSNAQCVTWWHRLKLQRSGKKKLSFIYLFVYLFIHLFVVELFMIISALDACKWQPCKSNLLNQSLHTVVYHVGQIDCPPWFHYSPVIASLRRHTSQIWQKRRWWKLFQTQGDFSCKG